MSMAANFAEKVFAFTGEKSLFSAPCHVLVGVSGGADSMALLHVLTHWLMPGLRVSAVHIHHGLRGETADRDEQFVRDYCAEHGVDFTAFHEDVAAYAQKNGLTLETAGRQVRYADFEKCRKEIGADYILTAHTSSDQVETVLMRIIRGTGVDGLCGILPSLGVIRRPLLACTREEVEAYCHDNGIDFVTDETNSDVQFTRNRIRHEIVPLLEKVNPAVNEAILRLSNHAKDDSAFFNNLAEESIHNAEISKLNALATPVRRRAISKLFANAGVYSYDQYHICAVEAILAKGCGSTCLPGGITAVVTAGRLEFITETPKKEIEPILVKGLPFSFTVNEQKYTICLEDLSSFQNVHNLFSTLALDYDKIQGNLCVRNRRVGDVVHPAGRGVGKSLKKLMNEYKVPITQRDCLPLLCDDLGVVLIPGYTCDERVRITEATKHFLVWKEHTEQG